MSRNHVDAPLGVSIILMATMAIMAGLSGSKKAGALRFWDSGVYRCLELKVEPIATSNGVAYHNGAEVLSGNGPWNWTPGGKCDA